MTVSYEQRRVLAAKVRDVMGELATVRLDGVPLADLIAPSEADEWVEAHGGLESVKRRLIGAIRQRVVRCRDCAHWRGPTPREPSRCTGAMAFVEPTPDGFCAWGEERGERE